MELKQKVLVVDGDRCLRRFFKTLLEVDGYHVDIVGSGKEAIARINQGERPDYIILDVMLAEMSGFEAIQELLRLDRSLNVIMTSCSNHPVTITEALRLGARERIDSSSWPAPALERDAPVRKYWQPVLAVCYARTL